MELLAPAGNPQSFKAALESGADAIYLGLPWFNARKPAMNFTPESLKESLEMAKGKGVKVYVTLNTDIKSSEIQDGAKVLTLLHNLGVHGVIIKDLGLFYIAKKFFSSLDIHLSTQFGISNSNGANEAFILGAKRFIPARELSLKELEEIKTCGKDIPEIETFVQGSMCFSFSGKCLLSSWVGGKSANRGVCQAPCRLKYTHGDLEEPYFSMKDLNLVSRLDDLNKSGASSLKIEGRLKSPGWVGNITSIYSNALKGRGRDSLDSLLKHSGREMGEGFIGSLEHLTSTHSVRFGKYLGKIIDIKEIEGESYGVLSAKDKDPETSLRFIDNHDKFLTIIHPSDLGEKKNENGNILVKNLGKLEMDSDCYEVIPARSENSGIGKFKYDVELNVVENQIEITLFTDQGNFKEYEKYKRIVKDKRGVYPDAVYDKLVEKVVNGWRLNKLYSDEILLSKTNVNEIVKKVSYILAVTILENNPLNFISLSPEIECFIDKSPQGKEPGEIIKTIKSSLGSVPSGDRVLLEEVDFNKEELDKISRIKADVIISLFPIMFEKDILEARKVVGYLEKQKRYTYEINDISQYNLLVRELGIPTKRIIGGQGLGCYNHISARFLLDEYGINLVSIPMELDSRGVLKLIEDNNNYAKLRFVSLSKVPGMYTRAQSPDYYEGAEFEDSLGTILKVHKFRDINIFYLKDYYSSQNARDLENVVVAEIIEEKECLENVNNPRKSFNLERRLY